VHNVAFGEFEPLNAYGAWDGLCRLNVEMAAFLEQRKRTPADKSAEA